ncbi:MAG: ABC transporter ATP-binding protein [Methanothrix sp.]|jgi:peptide/nickel transport system ATP-binding protein|uniref:ABC transporter ATP-binding protein n=1 Tax=Methanothrix sp. TaxID=90426 RepID=UPI0025F55013|nr:ABC transporter ATP-binding protein [Methanothrix sp.]MBK7387260.1 ABC transporter ATP-binding protein [Methanothrix sp.]
MLSIRGLEVSVGRTEILRGIDLDIDKGDCLAIIGESGAGKSTLGLSIMGLLSSGTVKGEVLLNGRDLLQLNEDELRRLRGGEMAMVFQNIEDALDPVQRAGDQIIEAISIHRKASSAEEMRRLLLAVGLGAEKAESYPHQLSGGEKQRVCIAMALANDPDLIILDEPTASLDAMTKMDIIHLLQSALHGRMALLITHDISLAQRLANRLAVLYAGRIMEVGDTSQILGSPAHPYTRGLVRSYPAICRAKDLQGIPGMMRHGLAGCPFHDRCTQRIEICKTEVPLLEEVRGRLVACHRGGIVPLLEVRELSVSFGSYPALSGVDLTLYEGETLAVVGESGSGKTTLSKAIMGLCQEGSGEIFLEGERVGKRDASFYSRVQMIFQNPKESVSHRMTVLDAVLEPLNVMQRGSPEERVARAKQVLRQAELPVNDRFLAKYPHQLSGGEVQRVAIARALALRPKLLIADEPTSALDPSVQAKILKLLLNLQERMGLGILLVTHDIAVARKVSDRIVVLLKGRIVEEGATDEILISASHPYTQTLIESASERLDPGEGGGSLELAPARSRIEIKI